MSAVPNEISLVPDPGSGRNESLPRNARIYFFLVAAWAITNLIFSISTPGISVAGHVGGLLGGALLGLLFSGRTDRRDPSAQVIGPVAK